jgi:hypothetical protein
MSIVEQRIAVLEQKIQDIDAERESFFQELSRLRNGHHHQQQSLIQLIVGATVTQQSSSKDKVNLFRDLFKGRDDLYPKRFVAHCLRKASHQMWRLSVSVIFTCKRSSNHQPFGG